MIRKIISAIIKRWGSTSAKELVWDSEYRVGKWDFANGRPSDVARDPIYGFLETYGAGGSVLDLGCGDGMTALEMKNNFEEYVGVDVSGVAIAKARVALTEEADRAGRVRFIASDISTFEPPSNFSVILF